jgi:hypothetical protein
LNVVTCIADPRRLPAAALTSNPTQRSPLCDEKVLSSSRVTSRLSLTFAAGIARLALCPRAMRKPIFMPDFSNAC